MCADGTVYTGCNIENAAFSATVCAERVAFFKAISDGKREFEAIAITGAKSGEKPKEDCLPCGTCRQIMAEFCEPDFKIVLLSGVYELNGLLPKAFTLR